MPHDFECKPTKLPNPPRCRVAGCPCPGVFNVKLTRRIAVRLCLDHAEMWLDTPEANDFHDNTDLVGMLLKSVINSSHHHPN